MSIIVNSSASWVENSILNFYLRLGNNPGYDINTRLYISLHTSDPTDDTTVALSTEVSGSNGYARVLSPGWSEANNTDGIFRIGTQINFSAATEGWGYITDIGMFSASASGSLVFHAALNPSHNMTIQGGYPGGGGGEGLLTSASVNVDKGGIFSLFAGTYGTQMGPSGAYSVRSVEGVYNSLLNNHAIYNDTLTLYARLYTTMPNIANVGGVELAKTYSSPDVNLALPTGYYPVQVAGTSQWVTPTSGSTYNLNTITLINNAQIDFGYVVGMCFVDTYFPTDQLIFLLPFRESVRILKGDSLRFLPGELKIYAE